MINEIERQLDYLGLGGDYQSRQEVAKFIDNYYIGKKHLQPILRALEESETFGSPSHEIAKKLRSEVIQKLTNMLR